MTKFFQFLHSKYQIFEELFMDINNLIHMDKVSPKLRTTLKYLDSSSLCLLTELVEG